MYIYTDCIHKMYTCKLTAHEAILSKVPIQNNSDIAQELLYVMYTGTCKWHRKVANSVTCGHDTLMSLLHVGYKNLTSLLGIYMYS